MKNLNVIERGQIQDWISSQSVKYYPTQLNYWVTVEGYDQRERRKDETTISILMICMILIRRKSTISLLKEEMPDSDTLMN